MDVLNDPAPHFFEADELVTDAALEYPAPHVFEADGLDEVTDALEELAPHTECAETGAVAKSVVEYTIALVGEGADDGALPLLVPQVEAEVGVAEVEDDPLLYPQVDAEVSVPEVEDDPLLCPQLEETVGVAEVELEDDDPLLYPQLEETVGVAEDEDDALL
jgi:hypothetical protein